jgi:glycyl-tRNA synthetase beta chain
MSSAPLLIEIGCEEIPAGVVGPGAQALLDAIVALLDGAGVAHGAAQSLGTPRRLTAHIADVVLEQPNREELLTGPPIRAAKDGAGNWTQAAIGFARGQGVDIAALFELETAKGVYVAARKQIQGVATLRLVGEKLPEILRTLPFPKRMRWGARPETFARPIHWIVALLGEQVIEAEFAGVKSGNLSRGHRFFHNQPVTVTADLASYNAALMAAKVMVDPEDRQNVILDGIRELSKEAGGIWREDVGTLETVKYLIEWPLPLLGHFDPDFLSIPHEVIFTTLRENQKLFTVRDKDGAMLPCFIAVANTLTEQSRATVAKGNTRVVSSRLADARFFVQEDTKTPLVAKVPLLESRLYLQGLEKPTLGDKVRRMGELARTCAAAICPDEQGAVQRATFLCKADLATKVVFEFPELQGFIGSDYARRDGEQTEVVAAIAEHYQPRFALDLIPQTPVGKVVSLADKLDTLAACFSLGLQPTGSQDQYGLRRAALGVLRILAELPGATSLRVLLEAAVAQVQDGVDPARVTELLSFMRARLAALFMQDFPTDLVEAVLDAGFDDVHTVRPRLQALNTLRQGDGFAPLAAAFKRIGNIVRKNAAELPEHDAIQPALLALPAERRLFDAMMATRGLVQQAMAAGDYPAACSRLVEVKPAVDGFFDDVMVMADDLAVRQNRLALLRECASLFAPLADFARIQA